MAEELKFRTAKVLIGDEWEVRDFELIEVGQRFRLYEQGGELVADMVAARAPKPEGDQGNWELVAVLSVPVGQNRPTLKINSTVWKTLIPRAPSLFRVTVFH